MARQARASSLLLSGCPTSTSRRPTYASRACRSSATGTWTCLNPRAWRTTARRTAEAAAAKRMAAAGGKRVARGGRRAAAIAAMTTRCRRTRTRARRMGTRGMETRDSRSTASHPQVLEIRLRALEIYPQVRAAMGRRALATGPQTRVVLRAVVGTANLRQAGAGRRIDPGIRAGMRGIETGTRGTEGGCSRDQAWARG